MDGQLDGGMDRGAVRIGDTVRRPVRAWTASVHDLLKHLEQQDFRGCPRVLGIDEQGREKLTYLEGETVGTIRPWPSWAHSDFALTQMGSWLQRYHAAVKSYQPPSTSQWREGRAWKPGLIIGHGDPAPYNAVWDGALVGLFDWDNAGPVTVVDDLSWVAFSWVPLHARALAREEGFVAFDQRRSRLEAFLESYGADAGVDEVLAVLNQRLSEQLLTMRATASQGDAAYQAMLDRGQDQFLDHARRQLSEL